MLKKSILKILLSQIICQYAIAYSSCPDCSAELKPDGLCETPFCPYTILQENPFAAVNLLPPVIKKKPTVEEQNRQYREKMIAQYKAAYVEVYPNMPWSPKLNLITPPLSPLTPTSLASEPSHISHFFTEDEICHQTLSQKVMKHDKSAALRIKIKNIVIQYGSELKETENDYGEAGRLVRLRNAFDKFHEKYSTVYAYAAIPYFSIRKGAAHNFMDFIDSHGLDHQLELPSLDAAPIISNIIHAHLCQNRGSILRLPLSTLTLDISLLPNQQQGHNETLNTVLVTLSTSKAYEVPADKIYDLLKALVLIEPSIHYITALNTTEHNPYIK